MLPSLAAVRSFAVAHPYAAMGIAAVPVGIAAGVTAGAVAGATGSSYFSTPSGVSQVGAGASWLGALTGGIVGTVVTRKGGAAVAAKLGVANIPKLQHRGDFLQMGSIAGIATAVPLVVTSATSNEAVLAARGIEPPRGGGEVAPEQEPAPVEVPLVPAS